MIGGDVPVEIIRVDQNKLVQEFLRLSEQEIYRAMTLFCVPYAGGSGSAYNEWKKYFNDYITVIPVELKGRGKRFNENLYQDMQEAVDDILCVLKKTIERDEYAIFGHSMGALLAYELYYAITLESLRKPNHIFFSGHSAPCCGRDREKLHLLSDDEFVKRIIALGGMPEEVLCNGELLDIVLPYLKNDFRISESYLYKERMAKIECNISVFTGKDEDTTVEEIQLWKKHGSKKVRIYDFNGNHFFINEHIQSIAQIITGELIKNDTVNQ